MYGSWHAEIIKGNSMTRTRGTPWVARLLGLDPHWGFRRQFLRGIRDYSRGQEHHTRGVYLYFALPPGLYEVYRPTSWRHSERYFVRITDDGRLHEITREEAIACLKNATSASAC